MIALCSTSPAAAQPLDEPYYEDAPCCGVQDIEDARPPTPLPPRSVRKRNSSGARLSLGAQVGYVFLPTEDEYGGALLTTSAAVTWHTGLWRVGLVLRVLAAPELSSTEAPMPWSDVSDDQELTTSMYGVYLGVFGYHEGFWGSASLGAFQLEGAEQVHPTTEEIRTIEGKTVPELSLAVGYDLHMGDHLAWRISGELGTFFLITWRLTLTSGLVVKF